ncbi:MAG: ABC transporter substrate-binding protein [Deltaproteobacteria bacterium]|jgi:NitT/TauT family transport system substrate-binding protein|nr:ABC transporter substrate-binding protein [Deltaproteobacteria bacterium]
MLKNLILLAVGLALAIIPATTPAKAQELKKIKVGINGNLCEGPTHIALEKGFFKEEGLDAELIRLAQGTNFEAITAGTIDASFGLLATLIQPLSNGLPIKITTGLHTGCDKLLVKPDSGIKTLADLKGKKIGVPSLTSSPIMFSRRGLAQAGVKVGDKDSEVEFIVFSSAELPLALEKGAIDALASTDPVASIAARDYKLTILLDSARDKPFSDQYCCAAYVSESLATKDPETAAKYTRAMQKAAAWIQKNPDETAKLQVELKYVAGDPIFNASVLKTFRYIPSVSGAYNAFGITAGELKNIGILGAKVDVEALHKNAFVTLPNVPDSVQ